MKQKLAIILVFLILLITSSHSMYRIRYCQEIDKQENVFKILLLNIIVSILTIMLMIFISNINIINLIITFFGICLFGLQIYSEIILLYDNCDVYKISKVLHYILVVYGFLMSITLLVMILYFDMSSKCSSTNGGYYCVDRQDNIVKSL